MKVNFSLKKANQTEIFHLYVAFGNNTLKNK